MYSIAFAVSLFLSSNICFMFASAIQLCMCCVRSSTVSVFTHTYTHTHTPPRTHMHIHTYTHTITSTLALIANHIAGTSTAQLGWALPSSRSTICCDKHPLTGSFLLSVIASLCLNTPSFAVRFVLGYGFKTVTLWLQSPMKTFCMVFTQTQPRAFI